MNGPVPSAVTQNVAVAPGHNTRFVGPVAVVIARTATVKEQVFVLAESSEAAHITVLVPSGKSAPEGGVQLIVGVLSQASVAVVVNSTAAELELVQATRLVGQETVGAMVSCTVSTTTALLVVPATLVTVTS